MSTESTGARHGSGIRTRRAARGYVIEFCHDRTHNSLSVDDFRELARQLRAVEQDSSITYVIIRSATAGRYCAGFRLDSAAASALSDGSAAQASETAMDALSDLSCPGIAIIDGPAIGAGCEIAIRCDLRIITDSAEFAIPAARHGFPYPARSIAAVAQQTSRPAAAALLLGETIGAAAAISLGIAQSNQGSAAADDIEQVLHRRFESFSPAVTRYLKAAVNHPNPVADSAIAAAELAVRESEVFKSRLAGLQRTR